MTIDIEVTRQLGEIERAIYSSTSFPEFKARVLEALQPSFHGTIDSKSEEIKCQGQQPT